MDSRDLVARIEGELGPSGTGTGPPAFERPPQVADHALLRRIGAGSYGEVWLARSVIGQFRAVKIVARSRFASERPYEREFRGVEQFEPISRSHAGLIQVLHVGRDDAVGAFYYVMELADPVADSSGPATLDYRPRTLRSELSARGRLSVAETVALGVQLCGALGHLHRNGLVHRDVKPSNVIFVQGLPKLADLGLVTATDEARSFVGTEGFIPPEGPGTVKADLFALGRLLYEAATGKDRCAFPELPQDLDTWPDRESFLELNEVLARLCAPDPLRRCANAAEAAGDLNLILAGRSVRHAYETERRLRHATRLSGVAMAVVLVAAGTVWFQAVRQRREEAQTAIERTLRERAEAAEHAARRQLYTALLEQARATVRSGELGQRVRALEAIRQAAQIQPTVELRREAIAALALPDLRLEQEFPLDSSVTAFELDSALDRLATCRGRGPVEIRRLSDNVQLATLPAGTNQPCYSLRWSRDGSWLSVKRDHDAYSNGSSLEVWDLRGTPRRCLEIRSARNPVWSFHPVRQELVTSDASGWVVTWDLDRGVPTGRRQLFPAPPSALVCSPDGTRIAGVHKAPEGAAVTLVDEAAGTVRVRRGFADPIATIAWHPDGRSIGVVDLRGGVHLLDATDGTVHLLGRHRAEAVVVEFAPTGDYLFTGGWERSLACWDLRTRQRALGIELDAYLVRFAADGRRCAVLNPAGIRIHTFEQPEPRRFAEDLGSRLRFAAFSPDGGWLAASADERLAVWDLRSDGPGALADAAQAVPYWTADGRELVASRRDDTGFRWRVTPASRPASAPVLERLPLPQPEGFAWVSLSSNRLVWTTAKGSQSVDAARPEPDGERWSPTIAGINTVSPDGRWLAVYRAYHRTLHVYGFPDLHPAAVLTNQAGIAGFQFAPGGGEIAVASRGQVEFWSTRTWDRTRVLTDFAGIPFVGVLVQPDGSGWWMARDQRFACLHETGSFDVRLPLPSAMSPVAVSADGRFLAVAAEARRMYVWDLPRLRSRLGELGLGD